MRDSSNSIRCLSPQSAIKTDHIRTIPEESTLAERIAYKAANPDDWHFIHTILRLYPKRHACHIARRYTAMLGSSNRFTANTELRAWAKAAQENHLPLNCDSQKIEGIAEQKTKHATSCLQSAHNSQHQYQLLAQLCTHSGVIPPEPDDNRGITEDGCIKRMLNINWWRRKLRTLHQQEREHTAIKLGMVQKRKDIYCSREALTDNLHQQQQNENMLRQLIATDGQISISLADVAKATVANPEIRYAELMTRLKGFETLVHDAGQDTIFITATCPSRMHSTIAKSGRPNPSYDGTTPSEAHQYLQKTWERARAKLGRENISIQGYRIAEPHHDGCPHWHLALATDPSDQEQAIEIISDYFTRTDPHEKGIENRVRIEHVRSIAGYLAKYISKNIDGRHVDKDLHGKDAKESATNVRAWASLWGIRQFQPIGGASVTTYRELRRIRERSEVPEKMLPVWEAADSGNWADYERLQGGLNTPRNSHTIQLAKVWSDKENRYGEDTGLIISGVTAGSTFMDTRPKVWTIEMKTPDTAGINTSIAEAMGQKYSSIEDFIIYSTSVVHRADLFEQGHHEEITSETQSVQLFTRGQGGRAPLAVAPTGAHDSQPNAPPEPDLPPLEHYEADPQNHIPAPDGHPAPGDYETYALNRPTPQQHVA